jgi:hypothetical protein
MNAKQVLDKVLAALSLVKDEVTFTDAKLADGTILQSPTFDLGESVEVVHEDGTKTPAPNGEHEVVLKDSEGNDVRIRVQTEDGKIVERSNVEEEAPAKDEAVKMDSMAGDDISLPETPDAEDETPEEIPQTMESLSYRIEELEKLVKEHLIDKVKDAEKVKTEPMPGSDNSGEPLPGTEKMSAVDGEDEDSVNSDEEELPKLDGAPVEDEPKPTHKFSNKKGLVANSQNTFLSKLYK